MEEKNSLPESLALELGCVKGLLPRDRLGWVWGQKEGEDGHFSKGEI